MIQFTENFDLSEGRFLPLNVHELKTVIYFDSDPFSSGFVNGLSHDGICPIPDLLSKLVIRNIRASSGCEFPEAHNIIVLRDSAQEARGLRYSSGIACVPHLLSLLEGLFVLFQFSREGVLLLLNGISMHSLDICCCLGNVV